MKTEIEKDLEKGASIHSEKTLPFLGKVTVLVREGMIDGLSFRAYNEQGRQLLGMAEYAEESEIWRALK